MRHHADSAGRHKEGRAEEQASSGDTDMGGDVRPKPAQPGGASEGDQAAPAPKDDRSSKFARADYASETTAEQTHAQTRETHLKKHQESTDRDDNTGVRHK